MASEYARAPGLCMHDLKEDGVNLWIITSFADELTANNIMAVCLEKLSIDRDCGQSFSAQVLSWAVHTLCATNSSR